MGRAHLPFLRKLAVVGVAATLVASSDAGAQGSGAAPTPTPVALRYDAGIDVPILVGGAVFYGTSEVFKGLWAPPRCRWCDRRDGGEDHLNGLDAAARRALLWGNPRDAALLSDVGLFVLAPLLTFGVQAGAARDAGQVPATGENLVIVGEALVVAMAVNQVAKLTFGRERPFVHALPEDAKGKASQPSDNNLSFFSGHATATFTLAAASGTVAALRGYRLAPLAFATGGTVAALTAYLRIAADRHYLTDVLVGAAFGTAVGVALPVLVHGRRDEGGPPSASSSGQPAGPTPTMLTFGGAW